MIAYLLALIALFAIGGLLVVSWKSQTKDQEIHLRQRFNSAEKNENKNQHEAETADGISTNLEQRHHVNPERTAQKDTSDRAQDDTEFWTILGHRLKITDTLLAAFTFALIIVGAIQGLFLFRTDQGTHKAADAAAHAFNLTTRAELTSDFADWQIKRFGSGQRPVVSFEVANVGNTHAHILRAIFDYAVSKDLPSSFVFSGALENVPAMLGPKTKSGLIVIDGLPELDNKTTDSIARGELAIFLRTRIFYQNILHNIAELRTTGRYGIAKSASGEAELRFTFPDVALPIDQWETNFEPSRRLNFIWTLDKKEADKE